MVKTGVLPYHICKKNRRTKQSVDRLAFADIKTMMSLKKLGTNSLLIQKCQVIEIIV
jgi:hypothetical protein